MRPFLFCSFVTLAGQFKLAEDNDSCYAPQAGIPPVHLCM